MAAEPTGVFERVVVGNDGSTEALHALRQALHLGAPGAQVLALTVAEIHRAVHAGLDAAFWSARIGTEAEEAHQAAKNQLDDVAGAEARLVVGHAADELLAVAAERGADLLSVGAHGRSRAAGIAFGSVATRAIHDAPCSVLVARTGGDNDGAPGQIVVGTDGSEGGEHARALAETLARATGANLRVLTATDEKPVDALVDASRSCDLLVVGSRGLHGPGALGSVAERVAHQAESSVLIVRPTK